MVPQLETKYVFTITAKIADVTTAGDIGTGVRRIIPIIGGEVKGAGVNGKVLSFGADFQIIRPNELIELEAKYAFETDDGAVVYVENKGMRFGPVELLQKLKRGEPVDPKLIYCPEPKVRGILDLGRQIVSAEAFDRAENVVG